MTDIIADMRTLLRKAEEARFATGIDAIRMNSRTWAAALAAMRRDKDERPAGAIFPSFGVVGGFIGTQVRIDNDLADGEIKPDYKQGEDGPSQDAPFGLPFRIID